MKELRDPDAIVIYAPGDGNMHMYGAFNRPKGWRYSRWVIMPVRELNGFVKACLEAGFSSFDVRLLAEMQKPGMSQSTPIILARQGVSMKDAVQAMELVHRLILESEDAQS